RELRASTIETGQIVLFTLAAAAAATALNLAPGIAMAWLLSRRGWRGRTLVETLVSLPLALLLLFGRNGPLGRPFYAAFGFDIAFTWRGVVLASAIMSFPLLVRSARSAFEEIDPRLSAVARTLGRGPWRAFFEVDLPLAWRGVLSGTVLSFARALGEFGATILVAGNIPGRTQTLALALFQEVQMGRDGEALKLAGIAALLAALALGLSEALVRRREKTLAD